MSNSSRTGVPLTSLCWSTCVQKPQGGMFQCSFCNYFKHTRGSGSSYTSRPIICGGAIDPDNYLLPSTTLTLPRYLRYRRPTPPEARPCIADSPRIPWHKTTPNSGESLKTVHKTARVRARPAAAPAYHQNFSQEVSAFTASSSGSRAAFFLVTLSIRVPPFPYRKNRGGVGRQPWTCSLR